MNALHGARAARVEPEDPVGRALPAAVIVRSTSRRTLLTRPSHVDHLCRQSAVRRHGEGVDRAVLNTWESAFDQAASGRVLGEEPRLRLCRYGRTRSARCDRRSERPGIARQPSAHHAGAATRFARPHFGGSSLVTQDDRAIRYLRSRIPSFECTPGCHDCCGPVTASSAEMARLPRKSEVVHEAALAALSCPHLGENGCEAYEELPLICRLFGTTPSLRCPNGRAPKAMTDSKVEQQIHWFARHTRQVLV